MQDREKIKVTSKNIEPLFGKPETVDESVEFTDHKENLWVKKIRI